MDRIPPKHIERFCRYRQILINYQAEGRESVFSHELASYINASPTQVRRDLMKLPLKGTPQSGYSTNRLLEEIAKIIDPQDIQKAVLIGVGNLGRGILSYFVKRKPKLKIIACFDEDEQKTGRMHSGCECRHIKDLEAVLQEEKATIAVLTTPASVAQEVCDILVQNGIKGIINFAPAQLNLPKHIFLENIDITTAIEKTAYFARVMLKDTDMEDSHEED